MISRKEQLMLEEVYDGMRKPSNEISNLESDKITCLRYLEASKRCLNALSNMDNPQQDISNIIIALSNIINSVKEIN